MEYSKEFSLLLFFIGIAFTRGGTESPRTVSPDTLLFSTIEAEPYMMMIGDLESSDVKFEGFLVDLWEAMDKAMDGKYSKYMFVPVEDGKYGAMSENGTWNGMIGELIRGDVDAIFAPLTVSAARMKVVDFTQPFLQPSLAVAVRKQLDINSVAELMKSDVPYGTLQGGSSSRAFENSTDEMMQQMYEVMEASESSVFVSDNQEGMSRVLDEDYAFIALSDVLEYFAAKNCDVTTFNIKEFGSFAFAFEKGSRYTEEFNAGLAEVMKKGVVEELYKKWWKSLCDEDMGKVDMGQDMITQSGTMDMSTEVITESGMGMDIMKNETESGMGMENESESGMGEGGTQQKVEGTEDSGDDNGAGSAYLSTLLMSFAVGIFIYLL